jgi:hypothetical protein
MTHLVKRAPSQQELLFIVRSKLVQKLPYDSVVARRKEVGVAHVLPIASYYTEEAGEEVRRVSKVELTQDYPMKPHSLT